MLGRQIDLHVGISVIVLPMACRLLGIYRFPLLALPGLEYGDQLSRLLLLIYLPAVSASLYLDCLPIGGFKILCLVGSIVGSGKLLHISGRPRRID